MNTKKIFSMMAKFLSVTGVSAVALVGAVALAAWSAPPSGSPPNNCTAGYAGCAGPLTEGSADESKAGNLGVQSLFSDELCLSGVCIDDWGQVSDMKCTFGAPVQYSYATNNVAATDGFMVAGGGCPVGGVNASGVGMSAGEWGDQGSIMMPVPQGALWSATNTCGGDNPFLYFVPMTCTDNG